MHSILDTLIITDTCQITNTYKEFNLTVLIILVCQYYSIVEAKHWVNFENGTIYCTIVQEVVEYNLIVLSL